MPKKENQKKEPNKYYQYFTETANTYVAKGFEEANNAIGTEQDAKEEIMTNLAVALAVEQMQQLYGYGPLEYDFEENIDRYKREVVGRMDAIKDSYEFKTVCENLTTEQLRDLAGEQKNGIWTATSIDSFKKRYDAQVEKRAPEIMARKERDRMQELVSDLRQSTQKSFTGRLKSFFVGNSAEYKAAFSAIQSLGGQTDMTPEQRNNAKDAIRRYLDLRGKKVRDHQYGRDRFDAFMKGMSMLMEPQEFVDYCNKLNADRGAIDSGYKGHIDPEDYMTEVAREKRAAEQERKAREAAERRSREAEERVIYDQNVIANNDERDGAIAEGHACVDFLRNVRGEPSAKNQMWIEEQMLAHPEAREMARKVVEERGLNVEIPQTAFDKLDAKSQALLKDQESKLQAFDRRRHPDLYLEQQKEQSKGPEMQM